jgi:membrane-associated phospholipid phosphatase
MHIAIARTSGHPPQTRHSGWAVVRGARASWHRFRSAAAALPRDAWARWLATLGIGFVLTALLMYLVIRAGRYGVENGLQEWDREWLLRIADFKPLSFQRAIWLEVFGSSSFLLPAIGVGILIATWVGKPLAAAGIFAAYVLHDPIVMFGWNLWDRARPDLIADGIAAPALHSYPSGHAANVVATFGFFAYLWARASDSWAERALAMFLVAALLVIVGLARIRMGTHWPSDIIAGSVIGIAWLITTIVADQRARQVIDG